MSETIVGILGIPGDDLVMRDRVEQVLEQIRPHLRVDGADVHLVDIADDGTVTLRLVGGCTGCPMSKLALVNGLENALREAVAGVQKVVLVRS